MLIIRRSKLNFTVSGIMLFNPAGFVIADGCITLIQFYLGVLVLVYLLCITNFDVLLTVHLSTFILIINQPDAQMSIIMMMMMMMSTCAQNM